ncbi:MAG: Na(+)/H(+) antiporter subunit B [Pseudoxanthomonas sp.]|nr:Na(+)/H(+) antiporter subunit B [Pseudoxanthomonas sp.]
MSLALDGLLAIALVVLALQVVTGASLFRSIVMFVVFGLVMALVWAQLRAPNLALAEAAIGAGISGALLMLGYRRLRAAGPEATRPGPRSSRLAAPLSLLVAGLVASLGWTALGLPEALGAAGAAVVAAMPSQAVANPVTAVLLVFRGYDTLLELAVLLVALAGARAVEGPAGPADLATPTMTGLPIVGALLAALEPLSVLVAGYLLHAGGNAPGGAFQGGAVLAAAGVLLVLTGRLVPHPVPGPVERWGAVLGLLVFSALGLVMLARGQGMLSMPGAWSIYLVESAMLVSIATTLVLLLGAAPGLRRGPLP